MNNIIVSILGQRLDHVGFNYKRWLRWRPTFSLLQHHDLQVNEIVLLYQQHNQDLLNLTIQDIKQTCLNIKITPYLIDVCDAWDFEEMYSELYNFAHDYPFDPEKNNYYFHITTGTHVAQICIYLLNEANFFPGKLIQSSPSKAAPSGTFRVIDLDLSRYDQIASRFRQESQRSISHLKSGIKTRNNNYNTLISEIEHISVRSTAPILLTGHTGVGKSRLAKRIFELKQQRSQLKGKFVSVNCATLCGINAMSTLFGHIKGAYTGANTNRAGLLMEANNGLLFLDEIAELGLDEQAMLLRAIEDKSFTPLGSDREVSSNFQLIAGTNQNLYSRIEKGQFRKDLLARINLWSYQLPALVDRVEDIEPNITYELTSYSQKNNIKVSFNTPAKSKYLGFAKSTQAVWAANFRDLSSSITRMATLSVGGRITEDIVENEIARLQNDWQYSNNQSNHTYLQDIMTDNDLLSLDLFERIQLIEVIKICKQSNSIADAGRKLFDKSRQNQTTVNDTQRLRTYLKKYGIVFKNL